MPLVPQSGNLQFTADETTAYRGADERRPAGPTALVGMTNMIGSEAAEREMRGDDATMTRIAVLVPCKDEARTIGSVVTAFRAQLPGAEIWVCDNASRDATAAEAAQASARVVTEPRAGKGNAVRRLFDVADADVYVLVDGDDTYDAKPVHTLISCLQNEHLDMVIARRTVDTANREVAYRKGHQSGNRAFAFTISKLFGYPLHDVFSGYRVFSRRFVKSFPALSSGFEIETELTVFALDLGLPLREIEVPYRSRPMGSASKLRTYRDGARIALMLVYLFEQARPAAFFGILGALCGGVALALGIPVVAEFLQTGLVPRLPTAVLSAALVTVATIFAVCGIILDSVGRGRKETRRLAYMAAD